MTRFQQHNVAFLVAAGLLASGCCRSEDRAPIAARGEHPPTPRMVWPGAGSYTDDLRPRIVWDEVAAAVTYDLELDDSCAPGAAASCRFPSPEVRARGIDAGDYRPQRALRVSTSPPVGRRYYVRLRACAGALCSPWTRPRYVEVGRVAGDVDGDGLSDVAVGAPLVDAGGRDRGAVFLYHGHPTGVLRSTRLEDPAREDGAVFGVALAMAGDIDADGFGDLVVGAAGSDDARGRVYVYRGGPGGLSPKRVNRIQVPRADTDDWFGASVAGAGDVDGDGFADILVGASGTNREGRDWGVAYAFPGSARGIDEARALELSVPAARNYDHFGFAVTAAGDLNGDGFGDVAVGSPGIDAAGDTAGTDRGAVYIFYGSAIGLMNTAATRLEAPVPLDHDRFGYAIDGAGDVDRDGFDDLVVGAPGRDDPDLDGGTAYLYRGGAGGLGNVPDRVLQDPAADVLDRLGTSVAGAGDINRDGFDDIVVGTSGTSRGRALVYYGSREGIPPLPATRIEDPLGPGYNDFAEAVDGAGDVNGDGFGDLIIGASGADNGGVFRGSIVIYPGSAGGVLVDAPMRRDDPDDGEHDHFGHIVSGM